MCTDYEVEIDNELLRQALALTGIINISDVANEALRALIRKYRTHAGKRLEEKAI